MPTLREQSTLLWLLYELFESIVNEHNFTDVVELAFVLLEPRIRRRAIKSDAENNPNEQPTTLSWLDRNFLRAESDWTNAVEQAFALLEPKLIDTKEDEERRNQLLNDDREVLRAFLGVHFQAQAERNRKGKSSMDEFNEHFKQFIEGLEELNIVADFDVNTYIFEQIPNASNGGVGTSNGGVGTSEPTLGTQSASFDKHLAAEWRELTSQLHFAAQSELEHPKKRSRKCYLIRRLNIRLSLEMFSVLCFITEGTKISFFLKRIYICFFHLKIVVLNHL